MKNSDLKMVAALLSGAAVGATLAVLFAPSKGKDVRNKIANEVDDIKDSLTDKLKEVYGMVENFSSKYTNIERK